MLLRSTRIYVYTDQMKTMICRVRILALMRPWAKVTDTFFAVTFIKT